MGKRGLKASVFKIENGQEIGCRKNKIFRYTFPDNRKLTTEIQ